VLTAILVISAVIGLAMLRTETYTTQASFLPQGTQGSASDLVALAGQFGVNIPMGGGEEVSPAFYTELLVSREILLRVASMKYDVAGREMVTLPDLLEIVADTEALRIEAAIEILREGLLTIQTGRETGIVTIAVQTKWPELSTAIAERLLEEIALFNLDTRRSRAAAERVFIEERVDSARNALDTAESSMQVFLQANRQWENSPDLRFQHDRLQRDISLRQQVYTTLVQSFEQARISEVRDTPVITVLQAPFVPPGPDDRSLLLVIALGLALGGTAGVAVAFVVEAIARPAVGDPGREDFQRTWEGLVSSLPFTRRRTA